MNSRRSHLLCISLWLSWPQLSFCIRVFIPCLINIDHFSPGKRILPFILAGRFTGILILHEYSIPKINIFVDRRKQNQDEVIPGLFCCVASKKNPESAANTTSGRWIDSSSSEGRSLGPDQISKLRNEMCPGRDISPLLA